MHDRRRRIRSQARPALLWTLLFFVAGHLAAGLYLHRRHPEFFDPEVTLRLRQLPARLAEAPGRPLALAVGSSRLVLGLRPASVMEQTKDEPAGPLLFNFSMLGAGPVGQRMVLHRLLQRGIQPKWLFVEVWPPILTQGFPFIEEIRTFRRDVFWSDVPIIGRLYHRHWEAAGRVIAQTLTPLLQYRETVLEHYAPSLLPPLLRQLCDGGFEKYLQYHLDDFGWVDYDLHADPVHVERARRGIKPLFDNFTINEVSDRALRDMLEECRAHDIQVVFLLMPDHSLVRGWYLSMQDKFLPYLRRLSAENHAPIVDARAWQPDEDIPDCCHLSPKGARAFSERFGREVYRPLLQGRPLAPRRPIHIAVTEWNTTGGDWGPRRARLWTLENALACARYHNLLHRHCDLVEIANRSNLTNSFCSGIIQTDNHRLFKTPTYYAQQLYAVQAGNRPLKITSAMPPNSAPDLSATLSRGGDAVVLCAVNPTFQDITRPLDLSAFGSGGQEVEVWTLADHLQAGEPDVANSFADPERIRVRSSRFRTIGAKFDYRFPALSLTVLRWWVNPGTPG